jgi:glycosyltransferase involved in cell wall biosynthesis
VSDSLLITVITACYNSAATLRHALDSVAGQDCSYIEHLVVDGASSDGTAVILEGLPPEKIHWISEPDSGMYDALNKGIRMSTGDVVGFLHADDEFAGPAILDRVAQCFSNPQVMACYGDLVYVNKDDISKVVRYWQSGAYDYDKLRQGWMPPHPTLYVRRELYEEIGGFDTTYRIAADYDCMLRLLQFIHAKGGRVEYIPEVMVRMRLGGTSNRSLKNIIRKSREDLQAMRRNKVGGVGTLAMKNLSKVSQFFQRQ